MIHAFFIDILVPFLIKKQSNKRCYDASKFKEKLSPNADNPPPLLLSIVGNRLPDDLSENLLTQFHRGVYESAAKTGAWIITGTSHTPLRASPILQVAEVGQATNLKLPQIRKQMPSFITDRREFSYRH
jgi:hypothetical protein